MSEHANALPGLHPSLADGVDVSLRMFREALGDKLLSLSVVGHALDEGLPRNERIQVLAVLPSDLFECAARIAGMAKPLESARLAPPLLMTPHYIQRSRDVFPIEFLHMQLFHAAVHGPSPLGSLAFKKPDVRAQCEREAKRYLLHIRDGLMRSRKKQDRLRGVAHDLLGAVVPLMGAVLFYKDAARPRARVGIVSEFGRAMNISTVVFEQILADARGQAPIAGDRLESTLREAHDILEKLTEWIDAAA
jgi:hypothetical protein